MSFATLYALVVLLVSVASTWLPISGVMPEGRAMNCSRHFGSGVIISTGFVHLLAPAMESLDGLYGEFPLAAVICVFTMVTIMICEVSLNRCTGQMHQQSMQSVSLSAVNPKIASGPKKELAPLVVMEAGIVMHSIFIGSSVAISQSVPLAISVLFHQAFEGVGIGSRISYLEVLPHHSVLMTAILGVSTPIGVLIGDKFTFSDTLTGIFDAIASGLTIYTGAIELMGGDIVYSPETATLPALDLVLYFASLLSGMIIMTIISVWA